MLQYTCIKRFYNSTMKHYIPVGAILSVYEDNSGYMLANVPWSPKGQSTVSVDSTHYENSSMPLESWFTDDVKNKFFTSQGHESEAPSESVQISEQSNQDGYITVPYEINDPKRLMIYMGGSLLSNKQLSNPNVAIYDYDVLNGNEIDVNNNGGATGLSGIISTNSNLTIVYV